MGKNEAKGGQKGGVDEAVNDPVLAVLKVKLGSHFPFVLC